jgi:hypothetical protein
MTVVGRRVFWFLVACLVPCLFLPHLLAQDLGGEPGASQKVRVIRVEGSHYEAGFQLGTQLKANLVRNVRAMQEQEDWERVRAEAKLFLQYSKQHVPEYVAEIQGAADAAELELGDLFATICEEIGDPNYRYTRVPPKNASRSFTTGSTASPRSSPWAMAGSASASATTRPASA